MLPRKKRKKKRPLAERLGRILAYLERRFARPETPFAGVTHAMIFVLEIRLMSRMGRLTTPEP